MNEKKSFFIRNKKEIYCFADNVSLCKKLLDAGAKVIQFRNKKIDDSAFQRVAREMLSLVRRYNNAVLIINDRVDIALEINADGIHIGQEDGDYQEIIRRAPDDMIIGVSVDTPEEAIDAERAGATYLGAGSAFPTPTKSDAVIIGTDGIRSVVQAVNIPVVAIGGISIENIRQVAETGAQYYAIISGINNAEDISARLNELKKYVI